MVSNRIVRVFSFQYKFIRQGIQETPLVSEYRYHHIFQVIEIRGISTYTFPRKYPGVKLDQIKGTLYLWLWAVKRKLKNCRIVFLFFTLVHSNRIQYLRWDFLFELSLSVKYFAFDYESTIFIRLSKITNH